MPFNQQNQTVGEQYNAERDIYVNRDSDKIASEATIRRLQKDITQLELEKLKHTSSLPISYRRLLELSGLLLLIFAFSISITGNTVLVLVFFIVIGALFMGRWDLNRRLISKKCLPIDEEIRQKKTKIARHKKIISNK